MLKHRLLMSALLIPVTVGLFVCDHQLGETAPVLFILVLVLSARCVWELMTLIRAAGYQPQSALVLSGTWLLIAAAWWPRFASQLPLRWELSHVDPLVYLAVTWGVVVVAFLFNAVRRFSGREGVTDPVACSSRPGQHVATLGIELFAVAYIGGLLAWTCQLRWTSSVGFSRVNIGYFALSALVVVTKMGDVGAYTFGRLIGGRKMAPKLSPGKTISGGIGHLLTAGLSGVAWLVWLGPMISPNWQGWSLPGSAFVFGITVGFAGLIGDLAESLIKRDVGVKDAPALLPGFGGLLDLMDSILLAGPVAYAMWHLLR